MRPVIKYFYLLLLLCCCSVVNAQNRTITGKIISMQNREAIPNASVYIKQLSKTIAADAKGSFTIAVPAGKISVTVSSVGYLNKEITIDASETSITISLETDITQLNEVVVVGYSEKKRSELTSAVTVVPAEKLKDVTANNIGTMLQGKVAGLQVVNSSGEPGATPEIRLRGISSVNASQSPLFVVDGIIGGNFDPNDVETVTVLKDAAATAMYGSQANAGVIIVTTKKAKAGKTSFEVKVTNGFRTPDFGEIDMMNGSQLYEYQKEFYRDYIPAATDNSYKIDLLKFYNERPRSLRDQDYNWLTTIFKP
ncbi:MAG TPA: carboxypeptidase-like regulatory domain-containing protein, partial [Chitinophagaceae bacterium]|nr:carboxypeptidase-like regulatory domain-containing protein [Chitinophagaceae bacterium]